MDKQNNINSSDWCDFSKDSTAKDDILLQIKREYFHPFGQVSRLTDDELGWVNAAVKPSEPSKNRHLDGENK